MVREERPQGRTGKVCSHSPRSLRTRIAAVLLVAAFLAGSFLLAWHATFCPWAMSLAADHAAARFWAQRMAFSAAGTLLSLLGALIVGRWGRNSKSPERGTGY